MKLFSTKTNLKDINILFVCMGNICRSPTAQGVFKKLIEEHSLDDVIGVDSAGTYAYHAGESPDPRAKAAAAKRGYDLSKITARKVNESDFSKFDYVLAMDNENRQDLLELCHEHEKRKVRLFLEFASKSKHREVPDPYYGGPNGFDTALDLIEDASLGLLKYIKAKYLLTSR